MNYITKLTSFTGALLLVLSLQTASAQDNIDANRMNRDINIMENVLQEMFKTQWKTNGKVHVVSSGSAFFRESNDIRGTYLPGYGIIFTIPGRQMNFISVNSDNENNQYSYSFQYGDGNDGENISEESITKRISEFLRDYGSTIGQLSDDDKVMVIYNTEESGPKIAFFNKGGSRETSASIPTISVVAKKSDLGAYRSGKIDSDTFNNRLDISKATSDTENQMDLKVMANIFETAFKNADEKAFRVFGSVDYLRLDNFGALFSFDASYSDGDMFFGRLAPLPGDLDAVRVFADKKVIKDKKKLEAEDKAAAKDLEQEDAERKKEITKAYHDFISNLKEYLVDYGRTLKSVKTNQHILVSVTLSSRLEDLPERVDMQIQKSTLDAMDRGNMSREQAMNKIQVREY